MATKPSGKSVTQNCVQRTFQERRTKGFEPCQEILRKERSGHCRNWGDSEEAAGSKEWPEECWVPAPEKFTHILGDARLSVVGGIHLILYWWTSLIYGVCVSVCVKQKIHQIIERLIKDILETEISKKYKLLFFDIFPLFFQAKCSSVWDLNNCF